MSEDNKVDINEILDDVDQLLTEECIEGVTLWDLVLESLSEVVEERILYGNEEYKDEAFAQNELGKRDVAEDINSIVSAMGHFGKSGQSADELVDIIEMREHHERRQ